MVTTMSNARKSCRGIKRKITREKFYHVSNLISETFVRTYVAELTSNEISATFPLQIPLNRTSVQTNDPKLVVIIKKQKLVPEYLPTIIPYLP